MQRYVTRSYSSDGNVSVSRPMSLRNAERKADRMREDGLVREVERRNRHREMVAGYGSEGLGELQRLRTGLSHAGPLDLVTSSAALRAVVFRR